ncbi:hypothetical protein BH20ACT18_BH20ACT18_12620 [soil metagenome]
MSLFGQRPESSHERTAAEREQARLEREARRRARAGSPNSPPDYHAAEERLREGRRAGVVDAPQRRIRVDDPPPEPWDDLPEIEVHPSTSETREAFESGPPEAEPFVYETEARSVEPDPFASESDLRDDDFESEPWDVEPDPFASESEPRTVEPDPFEFDPEPPPVERELAGPPFEPPGRNGSSRAVETESFEHEPEVEPPPVERELGGPPFAPPGRNGSSRAVEAEALIVGPEFEPATSAADPAGTSPGEGVEAPAREPGEDRAATPVAPPLPPRLKRFRQERMEAAEKPARRRAKRMATAGRPPRGHPRRKATPPPRSPREAAKAVEERAKPGVRQWIVRALVPLVLVGLLLVGWFMFSLYQPVTGEGGERVSLKVPNGLSAREIGDLLADRGIVDSGFFFALRSRLEGNRDELKAGTFAFRRDMSYVDAMAILVKGPPPVKTVTLTLPEGNTVRDFAAAVDDSKKVKGSYMRAVARARFNPARYGAPRRAPLEGFLFPATYEYRTGRGTASDLVSDQLQAFKRTMRGISMRPARRAGLTPYEVLIIASMVERETSVARERKIISGVIYNRLRQGIPLGIDATIRYATNNWKRPIRQSELDEPGPYNTRQNQGLPPTPIGNPGLASIKAAANPKRTDFLFFVVKPGGDGEHAFSRTDAEFQRDVSRYNTARDARGGRDPR